MAFLLKCFGVTCRLLPGDSTLSLGVSVCPCVYVFLVLSRFLLSFICSCSSCLILGCSLTCFGSCVFISFSFFFSSGVFFFLMSVVILGCLCFLGSVCVSSLVLFDGVTDMFQLDMLLLLALVVVGFCPLFGVPS